MLMRKFLCSLLLVLSALFSMAQNYTSNGGTLEFVSGGSGNFPLIGCIGDDFSITIVDSESLIASVTPDDPSNPTLTYANGKLFGSLVGTVYGTQYQYTVKDGDGDVAGKFILYVMETPSDQTITTEATSFTIGKNYMFQVSEAMQTYEWSVTTSQTDGYQFMNQSEASCSLWFLKQGTYILNYNGSSAGGCASPTATYTINVTGSQTITYTASDETLCKDSYAIYQISASESITTTLELHINGQSFSPAGTLNGNDMYCQFDLSGFSSTAGTYTASLVDVLDGNKEVASAQLTFLAAPTVPEISTTAQSFETGENYYTFSATTTTENCSYTWGIGNVPDGGDDIYPNTSNQQNTTISFPVQGTYEIVCQVSDVNGCKAFGTYTAEVSEGTSKLSYSVDPIAVCADGNYYDVTVSVSGGEAEYGTYKILIDALTVYEVSTGGTVLSFYVPLGESQAGTHEVTFKDPQNETIATTTMTVSSLPSTPTITSSSETFLAGQTYTFTANTSDSELTYDWTLSGIPYDGASIDGSNTEKTVSVVFNSALQPGQGTFTLYCEVTSNGCKALGEKNIVMSSGTTQGDDITYTAQPQVFCFYEGATYDTDFKVEVSGGEVPEGSTFHLTIGNSDIFTDRVYSTIYFELPDTISAGTYDVTVWNADKTKQLCTSSLTVFSQGLEIIGSNEGVENTPLEFSVQNPGTSDDVTYKWRVLYYGSEDPAESSDYTFSNGNEGSTINVTFLNTGDYYIACQREGQCASGESTHYVEVTEATQSAVCSINGKNYSTLYEALTAVETGDEILVLSDITETESIVDVNKSFTLNTNNHTVTFGIIHGMASRTITGGGVLNTALENSNTNGSNTLTIDNATLNLNGSQWMAKGLISLVNGASVTLTSEIFLGGGDEDGFNLSIDNTSSFNINGQNIGGYNCARIADQMSPYIPDNYTVSADGESLVFSPDANVILGAQPQQIERTYYVFGKAVACNGETTTVQIAAPQGFANAANLSITNADKLTFESIVVDTLLTVELPAGTYYLYDNSDDPVLEFSVETVTMSELEINGSDNVAIVGEMEQTNMGWSYSVPYTDGNTYDWTCSGDVSVTSERMGSSHWATVRFTTPGSYVLSCTETNTNGCSHTVTKDVTVKQYTYTIPQDNVVLCSGDGASVTVIITCNTVEGFNGQFAVAKDYTTDKLASYTIEEGDGMAKAHVTITEPGTYNLYYGGDEVDDVYYRDQINSLSFTVTEETITATITGPITATVDEEVTYSVTASSTLPNATLTYSWGGGVENSLESDLMAVGSFSTSDIGEAEVFCLVESENGCSYEAKLAVTVEEAQPVVSVSFPQEEYEITIGDSTNVCLNITSEEPNFNLDLVTIALDDTEGGVQFMETQNKGCFYIKALSTAGSSTEVSATVTYNNKEYYATTLVRFKEAPFELENCPDAPLNFEDGSYELQISQWFDVSSYSYSWSSNNEDVATVGTDGTVTFVAPGYAEILCTATNLYDQTGVVQAQCPLHIEGETEFTISEKSTLTVCQGESATVVITAEPAASFIVVSADNETIYTADNEDYVTLTPTMTTAGDYTYYIVEDGTQKKSFTITVNEKPTVTITALQSVVCVGDTVQLEASMNLSDGSFFWGGADNFDDATSGNPKFVATYDGHYPIFCQVTGAGNCVGTEELSLQVYPKPTVTISGPTEATVDTEVEYTATLSTSNIPATATFTYAWGGGVESYDTETIAKGSFSESDIEEGAEVFCIVSTTDGTCADTAKYPVTVKAVPATFWATDTVFCYDATGFVTIESSEAINTAAFGVQTADGTSVNFEPVVSPDNNQNNVVVIKYENIRNYGNGTYYITSKGEPVGSFQVVVNSVPRATFSCPTSDEAVVDETWNVSAPMAEGATYNYMWSSDGISFNDASSATQSITFETAGPVWVALSVEDAETGCVSNSDTCRFTIDAGGQKYFVPEEVTWCHGAESGRVTIPVTSNQEIPASLTVNHDWATNIETEINGTEATISFDYPYNGRQGFQLITAEGGDTTVVVENVNAFGKGHLLPSFPEDQDSVVIFGNGNTIELMAGGNAGSTSGSWYTALGSQARFNWTKDDEVSQECLADMINEGADCNNARVKFTFPQTGTYSVGFSISDDGCYSDAIYKNIYVVDFDPALFSIAPEKDTIEIGAPNGAQFTLNYDGEPYSNYTLKSDGDVTIDGTSVYDNEVVGTYEIYAEVSDLRVATAWITVVERPIEYTVEDVSVCEGTDEAVAVISASGSIYGRTVTVRDEDDNTFYPEYNDDNDAATVHLNYLSVGTYIYKVYEDDVYKTEFTVTVNSLPTASIECPQNPVVGDTWSPNTAMAEGMTYHWWSDNISSLDGATSCCPQVTFTEAGDFSATLVVKNNETGCLSEGATCEFTVGEKPQVYFLNCPDHDVDFANGSYLFFLSAGGDGSELLSWSTENTDIVSLEPSDIDKNCTVTFLQPGVATIMCTVSDATGQALEVVPCKLHIVQIPSVSFSQGTYEVEQGGSATICLSVENIDLANAQITYSVSNEKVLSVEPSVAATGCAVVTAYSETTETQQLDAVVVVGEETFTATADIHIVEPFVCEGSLIEGGTPIDLSFDEMAVGDQYRLVMSGTSAFTGVVNIMVEDFAAPATTSNIISKMGENLESYYNFDVYEGEPFEINTLIEIDKAVSSTSHNYKLYVRPMPNECPTGYDEFGSPICYGKLCQTYYSFTKEEDFVCEGHQVYGWITRDGIDDAKVGDKYTMTFSGTSNFDGTVAVAAVNRDMSGTDDLNYTPISESYTFSVSKGQSFDYAQTIEITQSISSEDGLYQVLVVVGDGEDENQQICLTNMEIKKETTVKEFAMSEPQFSMMVGNTKTIWLLGDGQPYYGDVEWNVYDLSGSTVPCVNVDYGEVYAQSAGQAKIEAKVNGTVVATAMVSVSEFTCDGQLYSVIGDNAYFTVKTTSEIVAGETYRVELEGTTDFDGAVMVTCGDFSSEEPAQGAGMAKIVVQAGVPFTYTSLLTIQETASSTPNYNFMVALTGENEESRLCATKLEFTKFEAKYTLDAQNEIYIGTGKMLTLRNIDGSVYGGEATWSSSDPNVATVEKGYVYGVDEGVTEIQAFIGGELAASTTVAVSEGSGVAMWFDEAGYTLNVNEELPICVQLYGMDFPDVTYSYDESVIELNAATTGWGGANCKTIKGLKAGSTMLRAAAVFDGETYTASAIIEVKGGSTSDDYTLAFSQSKYEITEGESISACLTIGEGFKQFNPQFNFDQTVISIANPTDGSDCGTITGLLAGHTFVEVIAAAPDGKSYSAQTEVIVNAKQLPYFVKQSIAIEVGESEQITVMIFDGGSAQASLFTFETSDATVATVGRDGVVTAIAVGNAEVSVFFEGSLVGKIAVAVDVAPQMPTPGYNTNVLTMCFDKSATTNGGTSLERMVYPTSDFGKLKWYDASGNELSAAPVVSAAQAGKAVYYVSQIGMGELANYRESEKVPYTVEIVYVAEPKLNVTDQSTCQGATAVPFVATTNTENVVEWTDVTGAVVAQGTEFLPQVPTSGYYTYKVTAKNTMGCVSNPLTVTYTVGNAVKPEIFVATQAESFVVGEPVTLGTSNQMSDEYSVVWSLGDNEYVHGAAFTTQFDEVGTYTVTCKVVETNTGCADSASKVITVEEKVIPLQSIVVEPETVTLYEGEQGYVSLAFEPSYASNMAYTIEVEDTEVADVAGLTVWAVAEGTTKATITSVENPDVKAEFNIVVNKLIKAKEISMPNIITLALNEETKVAASVIPAEASYNKVAFKEKADNVISIDAEGNIKALGEGTSTIVAYSNGGLQATAVVYVTAAQTAITDIAVPDEIELKLRDSVVVSYKVTPVTLAAKLLEWAIENNDIATFSNGVVKAVSAGETNLTVSIGNISKTIKIKVTTSSAPIIGTAPKLAFEQGKNITVDFADFVSDDETELANLTFEAASDDLNVSIDGTVATITAKSDSYAGTTSFTLSVTDEDGLTTSADVPVEVTEKANQAPVVLIEDVQIKYNACTYLKLSDIFSDDNTSWKKLKYTFTAKNVSVKVCMKTQLSMISTNPDLEYDTLFVTVTDAEGLTTEAEVIMYVNSLPNRAPKIAEIPVQSETDDAAFGTIELANYVKDDYTAASSIKWTTSSSDNLSVTIDEGVASVEVLNAFWNGAEAITFYAADEDGLKDSTIVYYSRKVTINEETVSSGSDNELTPVVWEGAPVVNIMAMKFIGVPGEQFIIMASMSGYDCTWAWEIEGANGIDQTSLMQMVSFDNPGTYTVKLTVQSADGQHSIEVVKENLLTVVGINERTPAICKGDAVTLTASEGLDSYYWSTGDVKNTTTARPDATTLYKLTMKKGMFTLVDTVTVKVSVPVALMEDSVMCAGTTFDLEAIGDYVSYAWNTGDVEKSITIPSEVASYTVTAVDGMQCVSVDTFNLTKVNDLPAIDLGEDQTPCDGTTVTLDAGTGYEYLWSTGATSQTIDLTANTETVWARIIDANKCINYDTVVVAFTYPYPEQIGVATFSQTTDHIILAWEKTAGVNTAKYRIERETNVTDNWEQVGDDVMFSEAGIVVDEDVNYKQRAYKYRLVTTDGCGNEAVSEVHRSMISTTTKNDDGTKTLQWCAYEPMSNVTQYLVLRGYDATRMDTVDQVPASNLFEIWNETDSKFVNDKDIKYRVVFRLKSEVNENAVNTLDGQPVEGYYTKAESGPFSLAMSNIAEVETDVSVSEIAFPADVIVYPTTVSSYINVAIASPEDNNFIVEVLNANGQVVAKVQTGEISKTLLQISAEGLRQGVYTVRISDGQQSTSVKVVK